MNNGVRLAAEPYITERGSVRVSLTGPDPGYCFCGNMEDAWTCTHCDTVTCMKCWDNSPVRRKGCEECKADVCRCCAKRDSWTDDWHQEGCPQRQRTSGTCDAVGGCGLGGDDWISWSCTGCSKQFCLDCEEEWGEGGHECFKCGSHVCDDCEGAGDWHQTGCQKLE